MPKHAPQMLTLIGHQRMAAVPHLADPGRIDAQGRRPLWAYAHVPAGSTVMSPGAAAASASSAATSSSYG